MLRLPFLLAGMIALITPAASWATSVSANLAITVTSSLPPGFYVATASSSPAGNDSNAGTLAAPFLTLTKCQTAMRGGSVKTCYIRAGTYQPTAQAVSGYCNIGTPGGASVIFTTADSNETWSYYPPDGYNTAVIDGQATVGQSGDGASPANGTSCGFVTTDTANNVTVNGLKFTRYNYAGIFVEFAFATGWTIKNNEIANLVGARFNGGGIGLSDVGASLIDHNYIHDVDFMGIFSITNTAQALSGLTISNNVVLNSCRWPAVNGAGNDQNGGDCGALYSQDRHNGSTLSTNIHFTNNYIQDINVSSNGQGDFTGEGAYGIYLDDSASNVTMTGNVILGKTSSCIVLSGNNDVATGNICDLDNSTGMHILSINNSGAGLAETGNVFQHNIVVAGSSGSGNGYNIQNSPSVSNNFYHNYVGGSITNTGDSNPVTGDPQISCWAATIAGGSPVFNSPVSFPGITGGWGPPGFVLPQTGTAPSWPHAC